jgi:formylmethanofuran dehydrogenase subunit E
MAKIYKKNKSLIIEIPLIQDIYNPYTDEIEGKCPNIIGVIAGEEIGFSYLIDRSYKDKEPDISDLFYNYYDSKNSFIKLCRKLKIDVYEYPICSKCKKVIYDSFTIDKHGNNICSECID